MKWSLSFCAAFFLAVRGDVTFVWESVTNHVIWIVYLINVHYVTIRYINQSYRVDEENLNIDMCAAGIYYYLTLLGIPKERRCDKEDCRILRK